jgi:mannose-6-phosphate isomerase
MNRATVTTGEFIEKGWGGERVIYTGPEYSFKILEFRTGATASFHFHKDKTETWYVQSGEARFNTIDPNSGEPIFYTITKGDVVHLPAGVVHQLIAREDTTIFEASTPHSDSDVYRIAPGDSQK